MILTESLRQNLPVSLANLLVVMAAAACSASGSDSNGDGDGDMSGDGDNVVGDGDANPVGDGDIGTGGTPVVGDGDGDLGTGGMQMGTGGTPGGGGTAFSCPAGSEAMTVDLNGKTTTEVAGVPAPAMDEWFLEGPVWINGALYLSQIRTFGQPNPAHLPKYTPGGAFETFIADAGTNGLAVNALGQLVAASHAVGGLVTYDPANGATPPTTLVDSYNSSRLNSPNDLAIRSDGTIYFTDPDWQCQGCGHQPTKGVYRVPPGGAPEILTVLQNDPNGIALSPDESTLYVGGNSLASYPVNADGPIGAGAGFGAGFFQSTDGLGIDCAGNVYVTTSGTVKVFSPAGDDLGMIMATGATNVAFGGPSSTTLFITGFGNPGTLRTVELNVPGYPY